MNLQFVVYQFLIFFITSCQFNLAPIYPTPPGPAGSELKTGRGEQTINSTESRCLAVARHAFEESAFYKTLTIVKPTRLEVQDFRNLNANQLRAIQEYSGNSSSEINEVCAIPQQKLAWPEQRYQEVATYCRDLDAAYRRLPKSPGMVFRGVHSVPHSQITEIYKHMQEGHPIGLGPANKPQWTSTSTNPVKSSNFAYCFSPLGNNQTSLIFVINQFSGVSIEAVATHKDEFEVLLSPSALFYVKAIHRLHSCRATYAIEVDEAQRPMDPRPGIRLPKAAAMN